MSAAFLLVLQAGFQGFAYVIGLDRRLVRVCVIAFAPYLRRLANIQFPIF